MWVWIVVVETEVIETEAVDFSDFRVDPEFRQWPRFTGELEAGLFEVVGVEVDVTKGVNKVAWFVVADVGHHGGKQCVGGDVERNSEEEVGATLVELAREAGATAIDRFMDVKLEEQMAGGQGHFGDLADVPCRNDVAA